MAAPLDPLEWGGPDLPGSRQANLDVAMEQAEIRHHGRDGGAHHRPRLSAHQALSRATEFVAVFGDVDEDEEP